MTTFKRPTRMNIALLLYYFLLVSVSAGFPPFATFARAQSSVQQQSDQCIQAGSLVEPTIDEYLASQPTRGKFYIQGWRWHTMSLIREAGRLHRLANKLLENPNKKDLSSLMQATDYVFGFNMKGLHKIEKDLFFPWVRQKIQKVVNDQPKVLRAFTNLVDELDKERASMESLGSTVSSLVTNVVDPNIPEEVRVEALRAVSVKSAELVEHGRSMLHLEDSYLVPAISRWVSEFEQKSFNNKVIMSLGILDSRLHLVGMYEAVQNNDNERQLFQETIPSIPQMMIPRWKRLLYEPRLGELNNM